MKKWRLILPLAVVGLGIVAAVVVVKARPEVERRQGGAPPPLVRVVEVEARDLQLTVRSQGTVRPWTESVLVAEVAGRIHAVDPDFADGGFFRRGEVLVRLDPRDWELAVEQAEARLAQARVRLELEQAEAEIAERDWQELGEGEPTALTLRQPQLAEARANLGAAEAALEQARLNLARTTVVAPFDGRVRDKRVDVGQYVAPGTPLAGIYSTAAAEIRLPVAKPDLAYLDVALGAPGAGPEVRLEGELGGERRSWRARVVRTGGEFDPKTRMLPLFARFDDPLALARGSGHAPLPMGLFVEAEIAGRRVEGAVVLPRAALRGGDRVLVVDGDSRLRSRPVEVLRLESERAVVAGGVDDGELVCVSPLETFVDGMEVRTVREGSPLRAGEPMEEAS